VLKDRLYTDSLSSISGKSSRTALYEVIGTMVRLLAPVLPFTCEEVWQHIPGAASQFESVHMAEWPERSEAFRDPVLDERWEKLLAIRDTILKPLESSREKKEIGNSLEAEVELTVFNDGEYRFLNESLEQVAKLTLVSGVTVGKAEKGDSGVALVQVKRSSRKKCERCWVYREDVGKQDAHPTLCGRCYEVIRGL